MTASVSLRIADECTAAPSSPSHALAADGHTVTLANDARLDRDIVVRWPVARQEPGLTLRRARTASDLAADRDAAFGLLTIVPPAGHARAVARDLVLLLDVSGSMMGQPLRQLKALVTELIESLDDQDRIEMIAFDSRRDRYRPKPVFATPSERYEARAWVEALTAGGGTEMISAIDDALRPLRKDATRQVVIVTDGQIGFEAGAVRAIRDSLPNGSRLHTVGVGSATNDAFLRPAARAGRGVGVTIGLDEPAAPGAARILAATRHPDVVDVTVKGSALLDAPPSLPDLLTASPVIAGLRLRPDGGSLVVSGRTASGKWEQRIDVPATLAGEGSDAIPALWAREAIQMLELDLACGGSRQDIDTEIEAIALRHSIASRMTSWIAVSESPTVDPREPVRVERIPQMLPYGMSAEGLGLVEAYRASAPLDMSASVSRLDASYAVPRATGKPTALGIPRRVSRSPRPPQGPPSVGEGAPDELRQLVDSLREPLDDAINMARKDRERVRQLVAELHEFEIHLLRDLHRLDVPTKEAAVRRHELLDRLEHLVSQAHGIPLAGPLRTLRDRLRELVVRLERGGQTLTLRGHVVSTPDRSTTTIEFLVASDLTWVPAAAATVASRSVDIVETGTTRPGDIAARSLVRVELSAPGDEVTRSGQVEIQNGRTTLAVTLTQRP